MDNNKLLAEQLRKSFHFFECEGDFYLVDIQKQVFFEIHPIIYYLLNSNLDDISHIQRQLNDYFGQATVIKAIDSIRQLAQQASQVGEVCQLYDEEDIINCFDQASITTVNLIVSYCCNMRCSYCYSKNLASRSDLTLMRNDIAKSAVDYFLELKQAREPKEITFKFSGGGEPLMNFPVIRETIEYASNHQLAKELDIRYKVSTNGILLTEEILNFFKTKNVEIKISIDGPRHIHERNRHIKRKDGGYSKLLANIKDALAILTPQKVVAAIVITDMADIQEVLSYVIDLGFRRIKSQSAIIERANQDVDKKRITENIRSFFFKYSEVLQKFKNDDGLMVDCPSFESINMIIEGLNRLEHRRFVACYAGIYDCAVSPDGSIYSCNRFAEHPDHKMGDVANGIKKNWLHEFCRKTNILRRPKCLGCWLVYWCGGSCNYGNYVETGDMIEPDPASCESMKRFFEYAIWFYTELRNEYPATLEAIIKRDMF